MELTINQAIDSALGTERCYFCRNLAIYVGETQRGILLLLCSNHDLDSIEFRYLDKLTYDQEAPTQRRRPRLFTVTYLERRNARREKFGRCSTCGHKEVSYVS